MLLESDIRAVDPSVIRRKALKRRNLDVLIVCAPCQPFSSQNRKRRGDRRANLILEAARFATELKPKLIIFENVPGLASPRNAKLLRKLAKSLSSDYILGSPVRIDAADFRVPQRRVRCIMLAGRRFAPPSLPDPVSPDGHRVTVRMTIARLLGLDAGEGHPKDPLHVARSHRPIALKRLAAIPKNGGSRSALSSSLTLACHRRHRGHPDVYGRMRWDDVAPTLTTGCTDITRGRFAHPRDNRAITLREAALLQTFPKSYQFFGSMSEIAMQIGNAVPVKLVDEFLPTIRRRLAGRTG